MEKDEVKTGFHTGFLVGGKGALPQHHAYIGMRLYTCSCFEYGTIQIFMFPGGGKLRLGGGIPGPPTLCMNTKRYPSAVEMEGEIILYMYIN